MVNNLNNIDKLLSSRDSALKFFINNPEIETIKGLAPYQQELGKTKLYFGRWQIVWVILKGAAYAIAAFFLRMIERYLFWSGNKVRAYEYSLAAKRLEMDMKAFWTQCTFGERLLSPALNAHRPEDHFFYSHPSISEWRIKDPSIRQAGFNDSKKIQFLHRGGLCRGMALWFAYLYRETQHLFPDPKAHMRAIGQCFIEGGSSRAALLQSFRTLHVQFLQLNKQSACTRIPVQKILSNPPATIKDLEHLPEGVFLIRLYKHQLVFIKLNGDAGFLFDPTKGTFDMSGEKMITLLARYIEEYQAHEYKPGSSFFDDVHFTQLQIPLQSKEQ